MSFNPAWDTIFSTREWGLLPGQGVVLLMTEKFYHFDRPAIKILDLGCGTGANTWYLASEGYTTYAVDGSPVALEQLHKNLDRLAPGKTVDIRQGDLCELPYEDGFFEIVVDIASACSNTRENMKRIYQEARRVLRPDGGIIHSQIVADGTTPSVIAAGTDAYLPKFDELGELFEGFSIAVESRRRKVFDGNSYVVEYLVTGTRK